MFFLSSVLTPVSQQQSYVHNQSIQIFLRVEQFLGTDGTILSTSGDTCITRKSLTSHIVRRTVQYLAVKLRLVRDLRTCQLYWSSHRSQHE